MFWALAGVILLVAVLLALWPLLAGVRKQRLMAAALALAAPAFCLWLYLGVGSPGALDPAARQPAQGPDTEIAERVERLQQRLAAVPENLEGWLLLGRTYKAMQRYPEAVAALEAADRLAPDQPIVALELAEARLFASGDPRIPEPMVARLERLVQQEPGLQKAYWLLGIAAAQRGDEAGAIDWWEHLLQQVEPGSDVAATVASQIAEARGRLGTDEQTVPPSPPAGAKWPVEIVLADELHERLGELPPEAALFVIVRSPGATAGPPLGVRRVDRPGFPLAVTLSDADSMLPQRPISSAGPVEIQARLSLHGQPLPVSGDWQSASVSAAPAGPTRLQLAQRVP